MAQTKRNSKVKKVKKTVPAGILNIHSSYNNTIVSISDLNGDVLLWSSAGAIGFKGAKKSTPYAAQLVADAALKGARSFGIKSISVRVKGTGQGKSAALRKVQSSDFTITSILDVTPKPHNGCRKPKSKLL